MRILLIAYYYPPLTGGGTVRVAKFAEHLPSRGHEIRVLTHSYSGTRCEGKLLRIHDPSFNRQRRGIGALRWLAHRLKTEFLNRCGVYHSIYSPWLAKARVACDQCITAFSPELILASYSPVETLELGLDLARRFQVPLISDFRDGLLFEPIEDRRLKTHTCVRRRYRDIEERTVRNSLWLTCALPRVAQYFQETYDINSAIALPNAFDPEDFSDLSHPDLDPECYHVVHTGSFARSDATCDISAFASALRDFVADRDPSRRLQLHQFGPLDRRERRMLAPLIESGVVVDHGQVDRRTCLGYQQTADLLLFITTLSRPSVTPGKIFEYLGAGTPILGLTSKTYAEEILLSTGAGVVVHPADTGSIRETLQALVTGRICPQPKPDIVARFSIEAQIDRLDTLLRSRCPQG